MTDKFKDHEWDTSKYLTAPEGSPKLIPSLNKVNRLEIIGPGGREFLVWTTDVTLQLQDDGRTLKVFHEGLQ